MALVIFVEYFMMVTYKLGKNYVVAETKMLNLIRNDLVADG